MNDKNMEEESTAAGGGGGDKAADQHDIDVEESLLSSSWGSAPAVDDGTVPVIDMSGPPAEVTEQLWNAATKVGFFVVAGHGTPPPHRDGQCLCVVRGLFCTTP
jgi:hypothetical protein